MNSTAEVLESVLALSQEQRASLVLRILESLEPDSDASEESTSEYDDELAEVVSSRLRSMRTGESQLVDGRSAIHAIRQGLGS